MLSSVLAVAFAFPLLITTLGLPSQRMISNAPTNIDARSVISPTANVHIRDPASLDVSNTSYDALINSTDVSYTPTCLTVRSDRFDFIISDPNDCSIAMIGILQEAPGGRIWEPFSWSSPQQWTYKSCSIALFPIGGRWCSASRLSKKFAGHQRHRRSRTVRKQHGVVGG